MGAAIAARNRGWFRSDIAHGNHPAALLTSFGCGTPPNLGGEFSPTLKSPSRRTLHERLFNLAEHYPRPDAQPGFIHSCNVNLVFLEIRLSNLLEQCLVSNCCNTAFEDYCFVRITSAQHAVGILCEISRFNGFSSSAEVEPALHPHTPDWHDVWASIAADRR